MSPEHARLAILLEDAVREYGSRAALARALDMHTTEIRDLLGPERPGKRFVTMVQAISIERVLGVSARELLIEAAIARIDEELPKARAGTLKKQKKAKAK